MAFHTTISATLPSQIQRQNFFDTALGEAHKLAAASAVSNAISADTYLRLHATLAAPTATDGIVRLAKSEATLEDISFAVCVWTDGLTCKGPWVDYFSAKAPREDYAACFDGQVRQAIYMSAEWVMAPTILGLLVLHEAHHARVHDVLLNANEALRRKESEVQAMQLEADVCQEIFGISWTTFISSTKADWATGRLTSESQEILTTAAVLKQSETFFGHIRSEVDRGSRIRLIKNCKKLK